MKVSEEALEGILKINLEGRMDVDGVTGINDAFAALVSGDDLAVVIDMSAVPYICSFGIRSLLINAKTVSKRGGKYVLLNPQTDVKNVLQVSGIDQIIGVCNSLEEAIDKVALN